MRLGDQGGSRGGSGLVGFAVCCCSFVIAFAVLAATSIGHVAPIELAVKQNNFNKNVDVDRTYNPGRYWIWPWCQFLKFPSIVQTVEFSTRRGANNGPVTGQTIDKFDIELQVAFQYQLKPQEIGQLYKKFGMLYVNQYRKLGSEAIRDGFSKMQIKGFWEERHTLWKLMKDGISPSINSEHATVTGLQILMITLPESFESTIKQKQVVVQTAFTAEQYQDATTKRADIIEMVSEYQKNVTITRNRAKADGNLAIKLAEALAVEKKLNAENVALGMVNNILNLSHAGLNEYNRLFSFQQVPDAILLYGVDHSVAVLAPGKSSISQPTYRSLRSLRNLGEVETSACSRQLNAPAELSEVVRDLVEVPAGGGSSRTVHFVQ